MERRYQPAADSVFVWRYDFAADSLLPLIHPMTLPNPMISIPDYSGDYRVFNQPAIGIADDGAMAVAWIARCSETHFAHVFYALYNHDGTPRTSALMADCDAGYLDTAACATANVHTLDLAMESDGDFYIVWYDLLLGAPLPAVEKHLWLRGFNADGTPKYDAVRINAVSYTHLTLPTN